VIDDRLIEKGMKYTGINKKKQLVDFALRELINRKERKKILALKGKMHWEGNLDEMRRFRSDDSC
jgi:Arc/MetJ family transcription regulator